jgi:hypothetical protein
LLKPYVEPLSEAISPLADFSRILLKLCGVIGEVSDHFIFVVLDNDGQRALALRTGAIP